jgi:hypothetical protein
MKFLGLTEINESKLVKVNFDIVTYYVKGINDGTRIYFSGGQYCLTVMESPAAIDSMLKEMN